MSSSPYEIRLDVLKLAKEILDSNVQAQQSQNLSNVNTTSSDSFNISSASISSIEVAKPYTTDDVISTASRLYSFIKDNR